LVLHSFPTRRSSDLPLYFNMEEFYKTAITQNHNVSYSSGNEKSNIYFSIGDLSQDGIVPSTSYDKTSFKINANSKLGNNFTVGIDRKSTRLNSSHVK